MTPREAVGVAAYIQAHFPSQPINEYTPEALAEVLAHYSVADARQAVLTLSTRTGEGSRWCAPSDVAREVKRIRGKRITEAGDLTPPPELNAAETRAWLGRARQHIADGGTLPDTTHQLTTRAAAPELRQLLARQPRQQLPAPKPLQAPTPRQEPRPVTSMNDYRDHCRRMATDAATPEDRATFAAMADEADQYLAGVQAEQQAPLAEDLFGQATTEPTAPTQETP